MERVTIRLSRDVVESFRSTGEGWQTRVDAALQAWLKKHKLSVCSASEAEPLANSNAGPHMELSLRSARAEDARRIADLLIDTRSRFMPYAPSAHTESQVRKWVASHLVPTGGVVVARVDGQIVGIMATTVENGTSWITQMAVDPDMVGRGIGSALLARAIQILALPIRLYTFQQNLGAKRFYERNGFLAIKITDGEDNEEKCPDVLYELRAH